MTSFLPYHYLCSVWSVVTLPASSLLADGTVAVEGSVAASDVGIAVVGLRSVAVSECVQEQPATSQMNSSLAITMYNYKAVQGMQLKVALTHLSTNTVD